VQRNRRGTSAFTQQLGSRFIGCEVDVMLELNDRIAHLEMCSEQLRIHLRSIDKSSPEADEVRSDLLMLLQKLAALKDQRLRLAASLRLEAAA
jgi:hypothetical protein